MNTITRSKFDLWKPRRAHREASTTHWNIGKSQNMAHALRGRYTHAKHSPETRVGSFAADVQQLSKSGRPRRRPVREAGFRDSGRRQILCGVLNKVLIDFDDFGARQARGRSGRFSDLPDRALETSRHERPRREAKTRPSSTTTRRR